MSMMKNRDLFTKDPASFSLINNGVAKVAEAESDEQLQTLRYELETFVCEGEYETGLSRILGSFLANLDKPEQPAVWISGFYGSGKSHLAKILRYFWVDYRFRSDGATARGLASLPEEIAAHLKELTNAGKRHGGVHAASGTLGAGASGTMRLPLLSIVYKSLGLPPEYPKARFVLWLKGRGLLDQVRDHLAGRKRAFARELDNLYVSTPLHEALLAAETELAPNPGAVGLLLAEQFRVQDDVTIDEMIGALDQALAVDGRFPCTLIVLDEIQQYIGGDQDRSYRVQEAVEACCSRFGPRLLFVGTGQSALSSVPLLQRLKGRFRISIELSDVDAENVTRKMVLAKRPDRVPTLQSVLSTY